MTIIGEVLIRSGNTVRSGVESRAGYGARLDVDTLQIVSGPGGFNPTTLDITLQHKNFNEDAWVTAGSFTQITDTGLSSLNVTDLRQQVRFELEANGEPGGWVRVLVLPAVWKE